MIAAVLLAAVTAMTLESADFAPGGTIPVASMAADCGGRNRTPVLRWSNPPANAKSFALVMRDPDAPVAGGFYHWVLYDVPPAARAIGSGGVAGSRTGIATTGQAAYYGPCPPPGPAHHYIFTLYALDVVRVADDAPLTAAQLEKRIGGHVLARGTLTATAAHP
ncbi:MAG: YbhB/YbcL family Raf kinase inhibitor-like protein [Candidatus Eremiobacteraeota bacterium]|nr:YbhB/YbcL family Raf kinase inhibitor-like protein [Candidatus Eremiobacteraeota bacterium]